MKTFEPFAAGNMQLHNRIVMPPMCMYSADNSGRANDFHFTHYTARALGGAGLIIMEATGVVPNGRITDNDLGLWDDAQAEGLGRIVDACHGYGAKMAIQLGHAGRKSETAGDRIDAPSALAYSEKSRVPHALEKGEIKAIAAAFAEAAGRADRAGFDAVEIHGAHGYLISEFLSGLANKRQDEYGGSTQNRARFLREVLEAVRGAWPAQKPILLRVSAEDYLPGGMTPGEMGEIVRLVRPLIDVLHVSTGGVASAPIRPYPGYQVEAAAYLKKACDIPVIAVGLISEPDMAEEILNSGRADLVALGRELLRNPQWPLLTARRAGVEIPFPAQYRRAFL